MKNDVNLDTLFMEAKRGNPAVALFPESGQYWDSEGNTPLHYLAEFGILGVLKHPKAFELKNAEGKTPAELIAELLSAIPFPPK